MRAFFITGTDTDVGKTAVTAALMLAFARLGVNSFAIKPVQTGSRAEHGKVIAPDAEAWRAAGASGEALISFPVPCSPHLAARFEHKRLSAAVVANLCRTHILPGRVTLFEGAGGLYVPLNDGEYMLDLMRELRLPVILVAGNRLGCINHTLLSLNALECAGLNVAGIILCRTTPPAHTDAGTSRNAQERILADNAAYLTREAQKRAVPFLANLPYVESLSLAHGRGIDNLAALMQDAARHLAKEEKESSHKERLDFDRAHIWHPYTSALRPLPALEVTGARGTKLFLANGKTLVDGMSSWWCRVHGYGNTHLVRALQRQAARLSHVMFGGLTHAPAVELGRRLLNILPSGMEHVFFADSGSVAVEVAIKMAVQYHQALRHGERCRFASLRGAYHGDTLGAMSLCDPITGMHSLFSGILPKQLFVERPACRFDAPYLPSSFTPMESALRTHAAELAAVVVEPVVQGAGGMWFYHPSYLRDLRALCNELGILLIADEIAVGFGRTGKMFACEWAGISPDIICVGKALTGGMMTLSAAAATAHVAQVISEDTRSGGAFMHGPTFMGNPLACSVACASIDELCASPWQARVKAIENRLLQGLEPCRLFPGVADVRVLGAIGVMEREEPVNVAAWQSFFAERGVWIRPFGRTVYVMPPFIASEEDIDKLTSAMCEAAAFSAAHGGSLAPG